MEEHQLSLYPKSEIKILVVDDREDNLLSIETILEKDNYKIIKANSGRAALKVLLNQYDFSLILMDVQMPDLNGFETANIIYERDKLKSIPIIFITAYSNDDDYIFKGYRLGAVDYIYKPINPELLRAKVSVFVELYRKNHQLLMQEKKLLNINRSLMKEIEVRKMTEEKIYRLNQQLLDNNAHLKQVNEELDQFAYMASHDLQEPLRKIQIFSDKIVGKIKPDDETAHYFSRIINASRRMQKLINNLLEFSRHSVNSSDFKKTDLNLLVKDTLGELEMDIEKSHAQISYNDLPVVSAVPDLMQRLFYNLLSNAIKFRKETVPPVVKIEAQRFQPEDGHRFSTPLKGKSFFKITVSDNGIGFDDQQAHEIFKVFKRLNSYQQYEGTGVGLAICKKIIEKHGGFITAESVPDKGSSFTIGLPETQPSRTWD